MAIVFDVAVVAIVIISAIICLKRGFVDSLFKSMGFVAAVACALILTGVVSPIMKKAFVEELSYDFVRSTVCKIDDGSGRGFDDVFDEIINENPELCGALNHLGINAKELGDYAADIAQRREELALDMLVKKIADPLCNLISDVTAFLLSFIVVLIIVKVLQMLLDIVVKLPLVRSLNKTLGVVFGIVLGCVRSGIFIMIVAAVYPIVGAENPSLPLFEKVVEETVIFEFLANNNILSLIINTFI